MLSLQYSVIVTINEPDYMILLMLHGYSTDYSF